RRRGARGGAAHRARGRARLAPPGAGECAPPRGVLSMFERARACQTYCPPHSRRPRLAWLLVCVPTLASLLGACRAPTEIEISIRTNVSCSEPERWKGVAVYVGAPGKGLEDKEPTLVTSECDAAGHVGTL